MLLQKNVEYMYFKIRNLKSSKTAWFFTQIVKNILLILILFLTDSKMISTYHADRYIVWQVRKE